MVDNYILRTEVIKQNVLGVNVEITRKNIKIRESFKIKDKKMMLNILKIVRNIAYKNGYSYKRTNKSWIQEWKSHNLLYKLNLFKEHTRDTDLEESESKFRLFCYLILGR